MRRTAAGGVLKREGDGGILRPAMRGLEDILASGLPRELIVFIIAGLPLTELRGSLPVAINVFRMPWQVALPLSIAGNLLPVPIILLFLGSIVRACSRFGWCGRLFERLFAWVRRKDDAVQRYGKLGLCLFVGIPLPGTGAWTGALLAFLLGFSLRYSLLSIGAGVIMAGVIVTALSLLGIWGAIIAGTGVAVLVALGLRKA